MSFLNHLKQRQAAMQAESNESASGTRKPRIPARLLLQSNTYASPVAGPLTAPYPQHHQQQVNAGFIEIPQTNVDRPPHSPFSLIPPSPNSNRAFSSGEHHQATLSSSYTGASVPVGTVWESFRRSIADNGLNHGEFVANNASSNNYLSAHAHVNTYSAPGTPTSPAMRAASGTTMDTPQPCRTVYLGNLPNDVTPSMVLDKVRCGVVEAYRLLPEKGCAFIAFIDAREAAIFHRESNQNIAGRRLIINGQEVKVAWGKPSPVSQQVMREVNEHNATRNVFFGDLDPNVDTEERIKECMEKYGPIDIIRVLPEKRIAFVHMCTIADAIRAVKELSHDRDWQGRRINYGRDRCAPVANPTSASLRKSEHAPQCESPSLSASLPTSTLTPPPGVFGPKLVNDDTLQQPQPQVDTNVLIHRLAAVAMRAGLSPSYALLAAAATGAGASTGLGSSATPGNRSPDVSQRATPLAARPRSMSARFHDDRLHSPMLGGLHSPAYPESLPRTPTSATGFGFESPVTSSTPVPPDGQSRTIYLGNLHAETTLEDLCNVIRGGGLEEIKIFPDRGISFITFLETDAASQFVNRVHREGLTVRHRKVKAGWGRPTPALLQAVREAVLYSGASRNVYIGGLPDPDMADPENDPWNVAKIKADFEVFGEVEMVNRPSGMDCAFVNFAKIQSAIRAVEEMNNGTGVGGGLMRRYEGIRVNYGKDRCANPPRPSAQTTKAPLTPTVHASNTMMLPPSPLPRHHSPQTMNCDLSDNFLSLDGPGELYSASSVRDLPSLPGALPSGAIISSSIPKAPSSPRAPPTPTGNGRYEVPQLRRMRASSTAGVW